MNVNEEWATEKDLTAEYNPALRKEIEKLRAENEKLKVEAQELHDKYGKLWNSAQISDQRLIAAAEKADILYTGCDTPDALADRILELELYARGF